eukprot:IDg10713t1
MKKSSTITLHIGFNENFVRDFGTSTLALDSLTLPMDTIGDIATSLSVQRYATVNPFGDSIELISRKIINNHRQSSLEIVWNIESGNVNLLYSKFNDERRPLHVLLKFDMLGFLSAFESMPRRIDFHLLKKSLIMSSISDIMLPSKLNNKVQQNTLVTSHSENFTHRDMFPMGDWIGNLVFSKYKDSVLQKTECGNAFMSQEFGAVCTSVEAMKSWALRDRMSLLTPTPQAPILTLIDYKNSGSTEVKDLCNPFSDTAYDELSGVEIFEPQTPKICNIGFLKASPADVTSKAARIAPALISDEDYAKATQTAAEKLIMNKIEIRKIRNREAAARSDAKRNAKRKARAQQQANYL